MLGGLSLPLLLGLGLAALLALGGMGAFVYKQGDDHGFHKRDTEVAKVTLERNTAKDDYAAEKSARESRDALIAANNTANRQLADASTAAQKAAQAAVTASQTRSKAAESLLATLTSQARGQGTESPAACPKTWTALGDASDRAHAFDVEVGNAPAPAPHPAAPHPTPTPVAAPTPAAIAAPSPTPTGKVLPPAIRVRKP